MDFNGFMDVCCLVLYGFRVLWCLGLLCVLGFYGVQCFYVCLDLGVL